MKYNNPVFTKALLTSVFAGIVATVVCLFYDVFFRESTNYHPVDYINVSSLIFGVNLIFVVVGAIYYFFVHSGRKGEILFVVLFILLTAFCVWRSEEIHAMATQQLNSEFRNLLAGIVGIMGLCAFILIPLFYHSKKFEDAVV